MSFLAVLLLVWLLFCTGPVGWIIGVVLILMLLFGPGWGLLIALGILIIAVIKIYCDEKHGKI